MPKVLIVMWYICYCYTIAGRSLGALMYLKKRKLLQNVHLSIFIWLLQKVGMQLRKNGQHNFIGQLKKLCDVGPYLP